MYYKKSLTIFQFTLKMQGFQEVSGEVHAFKKSP